MCCEEGCLPFLHSHLPQCKWGQLWHRCVFRIDEIICMKGPVLLGVKGAGGNSPGCPETLVLWGIITFIQRILFFMQSAWFFRQELGQVWGLPYLQPNKSACPVCWMLAEDRRLPGQTRRTLLLMQRAAHASCSSQLPMPAKPHGGDMEQPRDTLHAQGVCIPRRNPEPRQLKSFIMECKQTCTHFVPKENIVFVKPDTR